MFTGMDQAVAHVRAELCDVGLLFMQTELGLYPLISLFLGHQAGTPQPVESPVCLNAFMPQLCICQRAHRQQCRAMGSHIAVADGIAVTDIQITACTSAVVIHIAGRMQRRFCPAIGTMDIDSFQIIHLLLRTCMRSLLAALPHLRETAPFRILYVPDKPAGVEALESFQRHNADAIIFVHGFAGKILKYCHWDNGRHGIVIYREKETGAPVTLLAVDEKTVAPVAAGRL